MTGKKDTTTSLISIELTEDEQYSVLGLILDSTNRIISTGDKNDWLIHLERVEEKIRGAQEESAMEHAKLAIIEDYRSA